MMMTSAQVVETSVNGTSNSPSQDYTHPDDHNLPNYERLDSCTLSLSSLEHAMCAGVLPFSSEPNALSLMSGLAPDFRSSSVISTPVSSGRATAM